MRAGRFSSHIDKECSRCGAEEDEVHLFFLCPFAKAAWFASPWHLRSEVFATNHHSIPAIIHAILASGHPNASISNLYTFLWCLWKSRNDSLFGRKVNKPLQVQAAANAILRATRIDDRNNPVLSLEAGNQHNSHLQESVTLEYAMHAGTVFFVDAAWKPTQGHQLAPAGIGIFIQNPGLADRKSVV